MPAQVKTTRLSSKGKIALAQQGESRIEDVAGCLKAKRRVSLAEMAAAVAREAKARHARGRYGG